MIPELSVMCASFRGCLPGTQRVHVCNNDPDLVAVFVVLEVRCPTFEGAAHYPVELLLSPVTFWFPSSISEAELVHANCLELRSFHRYRDGWS